MPRYSYRCTEGHEVELVRGVEDRDDPDQGCTAQIEGPFQVCGQPLKRRFNTPAMSIEGRAFKEYTGDINDWLGSS